MKRFWLLALLMAGSLAMALVSPAFAAKSGSEDEGGDSSATMEDINSAMGSMAAHMNDIDKKLGLSFSGDMRLRYAFIAQGSSNTGVTIADQSLGRYRARLGASIKHGDFSAKVRIATGSTNSPWSQNNTFDTGMVDPTINIDTAEITWDPSFSNGFLSITAGKMGNPLTKTAITWDPDIQPEGVLVKLKKGDFTLRGTYFELQNQVPSGNVTMGNIDLFMDNVQAEFDTKLDSDTSVGLMAGYEYIPNSTLLMTSGIAGALGANSTTNSGSSPVTFKAKNPITGFTGVADPGGAARDWNNVEGMLTFKHKLGDVPMKWYVHVTDNLNGLNLPDVNGPNGHSTTFTNQYAWLAGLDIGHGGVGTFGGTIYVAQTDPNSQLPYLVDDDSGRTNTQYIFGSLQTDLESNVTLKLSEWIAGNEYYGILSGKPNQSPKIISYLDCIVGL